MTEFSAPWLHLAILLPLVGAIWARLARNPDVARRRSLVAATLALACALAAWGETTLSSGDDFYDRFDITAKLFGDTIFSIDRLSAPLVPLGALLYLLTVLATLRTKARRYPFSNSLVAESILLATFSCQSPWAIVALVALGAVPPWNELRAAQRPRRVFVIHMLACVALLVGGMALLTLANPTTSNRTWAAILLAGGSLLRAGIVPVHCWVTDLFEHVAFGTAMLFVTPMVGAYAAVRLVLPIAGAELLHWVAILALVTALYSAGMSLVQREARRFFAFLFLSHSSLVFVGIATATTMSIAGALCAWLAVALTMTGFGLTLRSVEARIGRVSLEEFHGLYELTPSLAALFLLTGLSSIGFPGTVGFVGAEILVEGASQWHGLIGVAVAVATAMNGLSVLKAYFRVFTGARRSATIDLQIRPQERLAVLVLTLLILGGGLFPQPGVSSRYRAAEELMARQAANDRSRSTASAEVYLDGSDPHDESSVVSASHRSRHEHDRLHLPLRPQQSNGQVVADRR